MSLEENPIEESETIQTPVETETKQSKDRKSRKDKVKPLAKVVVRRLPPTMTEEELLKQIEPIPDHDYFYFVPADWSLGVNATCRAYINFCNQNDIFIFRDKFDGYVFVDKKGSEYPAIVEFAPFQGLPKGKSRKKDHKANTIESEPHFLAFLESLKDEETEGKSELKMEYSFQLKDDQKITSTPLLEYLANVRQERRDERKRKIEDKKRQREEEKQRKKNQLAKSMPKTIDEDAKENDDGIIVRTIKSRPLDRDRNKNADKEKNEKSEISRSEREKQRNKERQARRKEERERNRKDREKEKEEKKAAAAVNDKPDTELKDSKNDKDGAEKVKKYSESRRDRKKRNESGSKSTQSKTDHKESADAQADGQQSISTDDNKNNNTETKQQREQREQKERSISNLKNKDRPSLQIYQPGKRRTNSSSYPGDEASENRGATTPENESCSNQIGNSEKPASSSSKSGDSRKRTESKESSKNQSDDRKKPANEKRISRYSEKRNKAKEKRDLTDNPIVASDCNSNDGEKNNDFS
ncbi:regulator of nonsense transcripts 3B-like [Sitodiplosis mosellana]|uniref:regulator of nonsense transcripts 3B-like n=1 Tax=Sitodiplosis mosellana TaxID=263140 RepID=UPI0024440024|nr:regulator of nonsense transcripts 3B-like [Sitodiplosis mosellana]